MEPFPIGKCFALLQHIADAGGAFHRGETHDNDDHVHHNHDDVHHDLHEYEHIHLDDEYEHINLRHQHHNRITEYDHDARYERGNYSPADHSYVRPYKRDAPKECRCPLSL